MPLIEPLHQRLLQARIQCGLDCEAGIVALDLKAAVREVEKTLAGDELLDLKLADDAGPGGAVWIPLFSDGAPCGSRAEGQGPGDPCVDGQKCHGQRRPYFPVQAGEPAPPGAASA